MRWGEYRHDVYMCNSRFQINHSFQAQLQHGMIRIEINMQTSRQGGSQLSRLPWWWKTMQVRYKWLIRPLIHRNAIASLDWMNKLVAVPLLVIVVCTLWFRASHRQWKTQHNSLPYLLMEWPDTYFGMFFSFIFSRRCPPVKCVMLDVGGKTLSPVWNIYHKQAQSYSHNSTTSSYESANIWCLKIRFLQLWSQNRGKTPGPGSSLRGLVFAFGAGGSGQLGSGGIAETEAYPKVVESLKEIGVFGCKTMTKIHENHGCESWWQLLWDRKPIGSGVGGRKPII